MCGGCIEESGKGRSIATMGHELVVAFSHIHVWFGMKRTDERVIIMTLQRSILWLKVASAITVVVGVVCALASHPATAGVWLWLFDVLKWPLDGDPAFFDAEARAVNAVLGGTMVGWGTLMYLLANPQLLQVAPQVPRLMLSALLAWFVVDCAGSLAAGLPGNLLLNLGFLVLFVPPLRALQPR